MDNGLGIATLKPPISEVHTGISKTFKASILSDTGDECLAYVKLIPDNQIISEVVCALVGIELGFKIPRPYLVSVEKKYIPDPTKNWEYPSNHAIAFGSEASNFPDMLRFFNHDFGGFVEIFRKYGFFERITVFDTWIANVDRNPGNCLFDGINFQLIDHAHAFTGPNWGPQDLKFDKYVPNKLLDSLVPTMDLTQKHNWKGLSETESKRYGRIKIDELKNLIESILDDKIVSDSVGAFLNDRINYIVDDTCARVGIPNLKLANS
jgi:HipA-like kinase